MKKKILTAMIIATLAALLTACGSTSPNSNSATSNAPSENTTPTDSSTTDKKTESNTSTSNDNDSNATAKEDSEGTYTLSHGTLLEANPNGGADGNTLVIKAKIEPSYNNKATIDQNYFNIEDIVQDQGGDKFSCIDYWAVADMQDGSEAKVVAFTVNSDVIQGLKKQNIVATELGDYVDDLYILPSLMK